MTFSSSLNRSALDRRNILKLSLGGALGAAVPAAATAQGGAGAPPRPQVPAPAEVSPSVFVVADKRVVDTRFPAEMAPGVFILPDKRIPLVPNIGIVVGRDTALVVDCGLGIESAEAVLALTRRLAPGRRIVLTVTHAHPEHGFGAQVFKQDARITYNRAQADYFARSGATLLDGFRAGILPPEQKHLLDGVVVTPPHDTYDGERATLDLGG